GEQQVGAGGEVEQVGEAGPDAPHHRSHTLAPVAGAEVRRGRLDERGDGITADLRRPRAEAAVGREKPGGKVDLSGVVVGGGHWAHRKEADLRPGSPLWRGSPARRAPSRGSAQW